MVRVVIAEAATPAETLSEGFHLLSDISEKIRKDSTVLILFDFQVPEGVPSTVNPETLGALISLLKELGVKRVLVMPGTMWGVDQKNSLRFSGLDSYIEMKGGEIIDYLAFETNSVGKIDSLVVLAQVRTDPLLGVCTAYPLVASFKNPKERVHELQPASTASSSPNSSTAISSLIDRWVAHSFDVISKKVPAIVINDAFALLEGNGPFIQVKSHMISSKQMILSMDIAAADWITLAQFGFNPVDNPFIQKAIKRGDIEAPKPAIGIQSNKSFAPPPQITKAIRDPYAIPIRGLKLYLGELNEDINYALIQLLYSLQSLLIKDSTNLGEWAILAGKNPPEPNVTGSIVLFGDDAINSTKKYKFRTKIHLKEVLTGDALDREVYNTQAKIREKIDARRVKYQIVLEDIIKIKEDPIDRELTTLEESQKLDLNISKLQYKSKKLQYTIPSKQKQMAVDNKIPKVDLNIDIASIPGNPPLGWEPIFYLFHFWSLYKAPLLHVFIDTSGQFVNFPPFNLKSLKAVWKELQHELKQQIKQLYAPLMPSINKERAAIKQEEKKGLQALKREYKADNQKIKIEYRKQMQPLQFQLKQQKIIQKSMKKDFPSTEKTPSLPESSREKQKSKKETQNEPKT